MTQPLGERLRAYRIDHGLTLAVLARRLKISRLVLAAIEDGVQPADGTREKIEALIGPAPPPTDWQATASTLAVENTKLAALVQSLQCQLADERRATAWFEDAAHTLQDETAALRTELQGLDAMMSGDTVLSLAPISEAAYTLLLEPPKEQS